MDMIRVKIKLLDMKSMWVSVCACEMLMLYAHIHLSDHTFLTAFPVK